MWVMYIYACLPTARCGVKGDESIADVLRAQSFKPEQNWHLGNSYPIVEGLWDLNYMLPLQPAPMIRMSPAIIFWLLFLFSHQGFAKIMRC